MVPPVKESGMSDLRQISLQKFKETIGTEWVDVKRNPKTGKLFAVVDSGMVFRVQQNLDLSEEIVVLVESDDLDNTCIINPGKGAETLKRL